MAESFAFVGEHWPGCWEDTAQSSSWGTRGNRAGNRAEASVEKARHTWALSTWEPMEALCRRQVATDCGLFSLWTPTCLGMRMRGAENVDFVSLILGVLLTSRMRGVYFFSFCCFSVVINSLTFIYLCLMYVHMLMNLPMMSHIQVRGLLHGGKL